MAPAPAPDHDPYDGVAPLRAVVERIGHDRDGGELEVTDVLGALERLHELRRALAEDEPRLLAAARELGASWAEIAPAVGVASRQAAERRYLRLARVSGESPETTGEQRVRAARDRRAGDRQVARWAEENAGAIRRLAGAVSALDGLDAPTRREAAGVRRALGHPDAAAALEPLAAIHVRLRVASPRLATELGRMLARAEAARSRPD